MKPPEHMAPAVAEAWAYVTRGIFEECVAEEAAAFEAYAIALCGLREAQRRITEEGMVVSDARDNPIRHPAVSIAKDLGADVAKWSERFAKPKYRRRPKRR